MYRHAYSSFSPTCSVVDMFAFTSPTLASCLLKSSDIGSTCTSRIAMAALPVPGAGLEDCSARRLHFKSSDKVVELVERAGGITDQESG